MTEISDVRYARSGDVSIAYQVDGDGPVDLVLVRSITGGLLSTWERPLLARHVLGLAENGRLLMLDKRGTGLSDRVADLPTSRAWRNARIPARLPPRWQFSLGSCWKVYSPHASGGRIGASDALYKQDRL